MRKILNLMHHAAASLKRSGEAGDLSFPGSFFRVASDMWTRPGVVRHGLDPADPTPLYTMDRKQLERWFRGYARTDEFRGHLLYAETVAFYSEGLHPIVTKGAVDIDQLRIRLEPTRYYVPVALQPHRDAMIEFFKKTGRLRRIGPDQEWENNHSARLRAFDRDAAVMTLQRARYFDQIATNLSVDTNSGALPPGILTIRNGFEPPLDHRLVPLSESGLANTLGVAGILFSRDGQALMRERSQWLGSINQARIHCSVSGVYELPPDSTGGGEYGYDLLRYGIELEIRQELNLEPGEYQLFPVALSRELPRHGKPQLFFVIIGNLPAQELVQRLKGAEERYEFQNNPNFMFRVMEPDHSTYDRFTYEAWAALSFANDFLDANGERLGVATSSRR
ncbi:hypothetical protein FNJ84_11715 [Paracoccus sp. M683]|uniref:hypothetical protein n=1 Tax=Paracoccus sp. M683 TaxID=2594268 RepID=UPI00117D3E4B|nr:hypothetical protein [Paracoccus sp. M683]TRW96734.1 hypothetical protein FNJ84_11715 [Paracoccus sp. M683]